MKNVSSVKQLGHLVKISRKSIFLTQKELAGVCGTGVRFIQELERGKPTCSLGKALSVVKLLGIKLEAKIPYELEDKTHEHE